MEQSSLFSLSFGSSETQGCLEVRASIFSSLPTTHYRPDGPLCLSIIWDYRKEFLLMKNDSVLTLLLSSRLSQEQQCRWQWPQSSQTERVWRSVYQAKINIIRYMINIIKKKKKWNCHNLSIYYKKIASSAASIERVTDTCKQLFGGCIEKLCEQIHLIGWTGVSG